MLLDTSVLITAYRDYYAPDICPGFWDCITHYLSTGRLLVIDRVRDEIKHPPGLVKWLKQLPQHAFVSTEAPRVGQTYGEIMDWVQEMPQFKESAKGVFASGADGWLVAYAMVNGMDVVTCEVFDHNDKKSVKLPNVCQQFAVDYLDTYAMLRDLGARFNWKGAFV